VDLKKNMEMAVPLLERCKKNDIILEIEVGVVGGEEDGLKATGPKEKLYTTPEDMLYVTEKMNQVKGARYTVAATFGNVHGVYKPGNVKLKPTILRECQAAIEKKFGKDARVAFVFHGGSGSALEEIHETLGYGVVKMNIDTDAQYAFTRPIADHMLKNYDGVLKIDGEVGNKKKYDPRGYLKLAENAMADRVIQATKDLKSFGKSLRNKNKEVATASV